MSEVINPPDYYFTGINFNPAFYADDAGGGLSETTANTLYLRKTVPDTATAIETFNLGIKAQKVDGLLSSSTMYVGNNITTGSLILGNIPIRTKNQGIFETASIRAPATNGTVAICGDATAGGGVDIGSANGTVNLLASSSGGVNVPTSLGASSNAVNVNYLTTALANVATLNQVQTFTGTNTFNNNSVTFGRPLTISYTIQPTTTQLGYQVDGALLAGSTQSGATSVTVSNITLPSTGVWNINFVLQFIALGQTQMVASLAIPAPESITYNYPAPLQLGSTFYFQTTGSYTGYFTGSTVTLRLDGGNGTVFSGYYGKFRAIRIA